MRDIFLITSRASDRQKNRHPMWNAGRIKPNKTYLTALPAINLHYHARKSCSASTLSFYLLLLKV